MHNLKPKKYLGQHFLRNEDIALRIVDALTAAPDDQVVEIGPGEGVLTKYLFDKYPNLSLVEVDPDAVTFITQRFDPPPVIFHEDILTWAIGEHLSLNAFLIGNLPYNISSPIFFRILENRQHIQEGVFMIQKEVAERICAGPGSKTYGILSVLIGHYYEVEMVLKVRPGAFRPPPKVDSAVIRMKRKDQQEAVPFSDLKHVVKSAFGQRRKTLRNALKGIPLADFPEKAELLSKRAEQLDIQTFVKLTGYRKKSAESD
ncbi:MAG: 16S rRNA (adenine(1518)-N(6)/adenine(1519)-N(6))-dimethyltransferase RsmA [Bacteroidota bacterium]